MSGATKQQAMALAIVKRMEGDGFIFANPKQAACVALAAIMETQRLDAELAARFVGTSSVILIDYDQACQDIEAEILFGEHYALAGDRHA